MLIILIFLLVLLVAVVAVFILIMASGITSNIYGAPYVPIKRELVAKLLAWGGLSANDIFYDLGCGDGRVLISAVKDSGVKKAVGYEIAPWPYLEARFNLWSFAVSRRATVLRRNFFKADLSEATFIYMYLFPKLVNQLAVKIANECRLGTKILCPSFPIDLVRHGQFKLLKSGKIDKITAYLYEIK